MIRIEVFEDRLLDDKDQIEWDAILGEAFQEAQKNGESFIRMDKFGQIDFNPGK